MDDPPRLNVTAANLCYQHKLGWFALSKLAITEQEKSGPSRQADLSCTQY